MTPKEIKNRVNEVIPTICRNYNKIEEGKYVKDYGNFTILSYDEENISSAISIFTGKKTTYRFTIELYENDQYLGVCEDDDLEIHLSHYIFIIRELMKSISVFKERCRSLGAPSIEDRRKMNLEILLPNE